MMCKSFVAHLLNQFTLCISERAKALYVLNDLVSCTGKSRAKLLLRNSWNARTQLEENQVLSFYATLSAGSCLFCLSFIGPTPLIVCYCALCISESMPKSQAAWLSNILENLTDLLI